MFIKLKECVIKHVFEMSSFVLKRLFNYNFKILNEKNNNK